MTTTKNPAPTPSLEHPDVNESLGAFIGVASSGRVPWALQ